MKRKTDAEGMWVEMEYAGAHRLKKKTLSTGEVVWHCYDGEIYTGSGCGAAADRGAGDYPKGRLTGVGSVGGWTNYLTIDAMGRTLKLEQKAADQAVKTLEYTYATNGFVKTMKYPSGLVVTQTQTGAGRTATVAGSNGAAYAGGITYGAGGMMTRAVLNGVGANRLEESRAYNSLGQMTVQDVLKGGSDRKWKVTNYYGETGNNGNLLKQWTETGTATYGVQYAYDAANRIRGAAEDAANESMLGTQGCSVVGGRWCVKYQVDSFGNAWTENKSASAGGLLPSSSAWFDGGNRLNGVAYYANGNQKQWVVNDALTRAEFDAEGRMVKAGRTTVAGGTTWDLTQPLVILTYNGMGQRVRKLVQLSGATVASTYWVYGLDGEMVAEWETGAVGAGRQYLLSDQLGSTRVRLDGNGEVLQRLDYEPYGVEVQRAGVSGYSGENEVRVKYTGQVRDPEVGADFYNARYLGLGLGRFTSPDGPLMDQQVEDPRSWNLISYVRSNPLRFIDPTGQACTVDWKDDDRPGPTCAQVRKDNEKPKPSVIVQANLDQVLTQEEEQTVNRQIREELAPHSVISLIGLPSPERWISEKTHSPIQNVSDPNVCFYAPGFILDNRALFGLPPSGPPVDPMLGNGPGATYMPNGKSKNGGYGPITNNSAREIKGGIIAEILGYASNVFKCRALVGGQ